MDEPASALDPIATLKIEELMQELKKHYTIVIVTHNMQQAAACFGLHCHDDAVRRGHALRHGHRVRRDQQDLHHVRTTSAPRTTSPAGLDSDVVIQNATEKAEDQMPENL